MQSQAYKQDGNALQRAFDTVATPRPNRRQRRAAAAQKRRAVRALIKKLRRLEKRLLRNTDLA